MPTDRLIYSQHGSSQPLAPPRRPAAAGQQTPPARVHYQPRQTDLQPGKFEHAGQVAPPAVLEILAGSVGGPNNSGDI